MIKHGYAPRRIGFRTIATQGFTGEHIVGSVPIYEFHLLILENSVPVSVRSDEFPNYQTNIKTLFIGRVTIWHHNWFPDRDPQGVPSLRCAQRFTPLVRAREQLLRLLPFHFEPPVAHQRPDSDPPNSKVGSCTSSINLICSIGELGGGTYDLLLGRFQGGHLVSGISCPEHETSERLY